MGRRRGRRGRRVCGRSGDVDSSEFERKTIRNWKKEGRKEGRGGRRGKWRRRKRKRRRGTWRRRKKK